MIIQLQVLLLPFDVFEACNCCRCGPQPNSRLLLNYGFVDEENANDRLVVQVRPESLPMSTILCLCQCCRVCLVFHVIQAALDTEDPQYQEKRMVAQRNGKLSIQAFQVRYQSLEPFVRASLSHTLQSLEYGCLRGYKPTD